MSECGICYEAIEDKNCCTTKCGHSFHLECLRRCSGMNCPYCRQAYCDPVVAVKPPQQPNAFGNPNVNLLLQPCEDPYYKHKRVPYYTWRMLEDRRISVEFCDKTKQHPLNVVWYTKWHYNSLYQDLKSYVEENNVQKQHNLIIVDATLAQYLGIQIGSKMYGKKLVGLIQEKIAEHANNLNFV